MWAAYLHWLIVGIYIIFISRSPHCLTQLFSLLLLLSHKTRSECDIANVYSVCSTVLNVQRFKENAQASLNGMKYNIIIYDDHIGFANETLKKMFIWRCDLYLEHANAQTMNKFETTHKHQFFPLLESHILGDYDYYYCYSNLIYTHLYIPLHAKYK